MIRLATERVQGTNVYFDRELGTKFWRVSIGDTRLTADFISLFKSKKQALRFIKKNVKFTGGTTRHSEIVSAKDLGHIL